MTYQYAMQLWTYLNVDAAMETRSHRRIGLACTCKGTLTTRKTLETTLEMKVSALNADIYWARRKFRVLTHNGRLSFASEMLKISVKKSYHRLNHTADNTYAALARERGE